MTITIPNIYGATGSNAIWSISPGAVGPVGSSSGTFTVNTTSWATYGETQIENDVVIRRPGKNDIHVAKTLEALLDRLSVIQPNLELMEKYPALREAYENYKVMEALLVGENEENENE